MEAWADTLRITPETLADEKVMVMTSVAEQARIGFFSLRLEGDQWWLEHFWIAPDRMRQGWGRAMFGAAMQRACELGAAQVQIKSDPYAEAFYLRQGARRTGEEHTLLLGKYPRVLPLLKVDLAASL